MRGAHERTTIAAAATVAIMLVLGCGGDGRRSSDAGPRDDAGGGTDAGADGGADADGGPPAFTCELLTDPDQCWNRIVRQLQACTPGGVGVLDADRTGCTYPDGTTVRFDSFVPTSGDYRPNFTVLDPSGTECGSYSAGGFNLGVVSVAAENGYATVDQEPGPRLRLACVVDEVESVVFDAAYTEFDACLSGADVIVPPGYNAFVDETSVRIEIVSEGVLRPDPIVDCTQG